jgi:ketosteroid isomerase-like protein
MIVLLAVLSLMSTGDPSEDIVMVLSAQADAWNAGNIAGYMKGYWESDSLIFTSGGRVHRGWQAAMNKYLATYDTPEKMGKLMFTDLEISLLSSTSACVLGRWTLERATDRPTGVFTLVMKRFPEGWRIVHDHTSSGTE